MMRTDRRKSIRLILLTVICILLLGAVVLVGAAAMCNQQLPHITLTDALAHFEVEQDATASALVARAAAYVHQHSSPLVRAGSGAALTNVFLCEGENCTLNRTIVEFGLEPLIRCDGNHTTIHLVQFEFLPQQDAVTAQTVELNGGHIITDREFAALQPTIEDALQQARQQLPDAVQGDVYQAQVSIAVAGWNVSFYTEEAAAPFFSVEIPFS